MSEQLQQPLQTSVIQNLHGLDDGVGGLDARFTKTEAKVSNQNVENNVTGDDVNSGSPRASESSLQEVVIKRENAAEQTVWQEFEEEKRGEEDVVVNVPDVTTATEPQQIQSQMNGVHDETAQKTSSDVDANCNVSQNEDTVQEEKETGKFSEAVAKMLEVLKNKCWEWERRREADFGEEKLGAMVYGFICGYIMTKNQPQTFSFQQPLEPLRIMERSLDGLGSGFEESQPPYDDMMNYMMFQNEHYKHRNPDSKKRAAQDLHDNYSNGDRMFSFPNQLQQQNDHYFDIHYMPEQKRPRSSRSSAGPSYGSASSREEKIQAYQTALGVQREGVLELFQKQPWCERQKPNTVYRQWDTLKTYLLREPNWYKQWREFAVVSKAAVLSRVSNNSDRLEYVLNTKPEKSSMYQILTRSDQEFNRKFPLFREWVKENKQLQSPNRFLMHPQHQLSLPL
eukprot:TRINITY_DN28700_c0_g1_i1.p1 TRINITY_DN28700_c0_g1~~TRINITY_DN28700_c0_g1_i1.p1  ORF type:complete len:453 (-),score=89.78 TRINITY_DN28700_c0_g1_i1:169-1527(-)